MNGKRHFWRKPGTSLWWSMGVAASCYGDVFQRQGLRDLSGLSERWAEQSTERSLMKTCSRALRTSDWVKGWPSNRTMTLSTQPRQPRSGFGTSLWMSLSGPARAWTWTQSEIAVQRCSPSNLTELERICREECEKLPKYRCAKLVASYPRRLKAGQWKQDASELNSKSHRKGSE